MLVPKYLSLVVLCLSYGLAAQRSYQFDTQLVYKNVDSLEASRNKIVTVLSNSKDNSYAAVVLNRNASEYRIEFFEDQVLDASISVNKSVFKSGADLVLDCKGVRKWEDGFWGDFKKLHYSSRDTLIGSVSYRLIDVFKANRSGKPKKKSSRIVYVMDESIDHVPPFRWPGRFEFWDVSKFFEKGLPVLIINQTAKRSMELEKMKTTRRQLIITENCKL